MGGVVDRYRRFVVDGTPVATGMISVGDAWACTNPSLGRGITMGLMHAAGTADVVREHLSDPLALALAHDEMTQATVTPWYWNTIELDRARRAQLNAAMADGQPSRGAPDPVSANPAQRDGPARLDPATSIQRAFAVAMLHDADVFRAFVEIVSMHALPHEVLSRPGMAERIIAVAAEHDEFTVPGPSRADLLSTLA